MGDKGMTSAVFCRWSGRQLALLEEPVRTEPSIRASQQPDLTPCCGWHKGKPPCLHLMRSDQTKQHVPIVIEARRHPVEYYFHFLHPATRDWYGVWESQPNVSRTSIATFGFKRPCCFATGHWEKKAGALSMALTLRTKPRQK